MRSCTERTYPWGLGALVLLLCIGALLPPAALGSIQPATGVRQYPDPAKWGTDLDEAIGRARISLRPMLVFFTAPNCPACQQTRQFSLKNAALQPLLHKFERVEIDLSKRPELATVFQIEKAPALYVIDPDGRVTGHRVGYATAKSLQKYLENIIAGHWSAREMDRLITAVASGRASADQWRKALSAMDNSDIRGRMQALTGRLSPGDIKILAACLGDRQLAVRLGALDLLEQVNDTITGFDPWDGPRSGGGREPLERWRQWADSGQGPSTPTPELTQEKFDRYIQDLIGGDPHRSGHALQVLEHGGQPAARFIVDYFQSHPALDANALRRIKEVQYALVIPSSTGLDPRNTAHRIVWGNLDVQIRTLRQLADCGIGPAAILVDQLAHDDPLMRETAVEILFKAAGPLAVAPVKNLLEREKDADVCFSVLKHLGDTNTPESQRILQSYFTNDNEDLVIAAVQGAVKQSVGSLGDKLLPLLQDPRWRIRVAAIEGIREKGGQEAGLFDRLRGKEKKVPDRISRALFKCLEDPDEFVRHTAAATLEKLKIGGAEGPLKAAYDRYPDMHGVVVSVLMAMGKSVPSSCIDELFGPDPDDLLFVLDNIREIDGSSRELVQRAAKSENPDIACSALRIIAGTEKRQASDNALLIAALESGKTEKVLTVIQEFDLDSDGIKEVRSVLKSLSSPEKERVRRSRDTHTDVLLAAAGLMDDPSVSGMVRNNAMILLCKFGYAGAFESASQSWSELTASMRAAVVESLPMYGKDAVPLFRQALSDDYTDVWQAALNQVADAEGRKWFVEPLLDYLMAPVCRLTPTMMWPEGLQSLCREDPIALIPYARKILSASEAHPADRLILALTVYTFTKIPESGQAPVFALTKDKNSLVRRAAWLAWLTQSKKAFEKHFDALMADPSRHVRELIPAVLTNNIYDKTRVTLYFSEEEYFSGYRGLQIDFGKASEDGSDAGTAYDYDRERTISSPVVDKIKSMIADEPDPLIRFRCMLCLLSYKIPLDLGEVYATARESGSPKIVADLLEDFISTHRFELGETFRTLLPLVQTPDGNGVSEYVMDGLLNQWGGKAQPTTEKARLSFTAVEEPSPSNPQMATFTGGDSLAAERMQSPVEVALFVTSGCRRCFAVEKYIQMLEFRYRNLRLHRYDILTRQGLAYNEVLSRRFMIEDANRDTVPAVFMTAGYLMDRDITFFSLEKLASFSSIRYAEKDVLAVSPEELAAADGLIRDRRESFSWLGIAQTAFSRGLSPLALAALLLVLYYLTLARRTGSSIMRYGALYMVTAAAVTIALWLLPREGNADGTYLHDISGALMWLILLYMAIIALRFFFRSLWRLRKKADSRIRTKKIKKIPGRRYVLGIVAMWAFVMVVLDILAPGNTQTAILVYCIKNQVSLVPSVLMLILFCIIFMLPSAGIFWGFAQLTRNAKIQSFIAGHQFPTNMALSAIWIWMMVKYFQVL